MNKIWRQVVLTASALATSALLAACGGGDAGAPPDKTPPTVAISSNTAGTAQGPVTFTFVFSEDVGTSFSANDVDAGAASKGAFTRFTGTVASLVVTPPANSSGSFTVRVPAGTFADAAGNDNTAAATAAQSFDTSTGQASGNTGTCTGSCIDFSGASVKYETFEGLVSAAQANDPADANNKVAKFVKGPAGQPWAGATLYTVDANKSVPAIDLSGSKVVTLRVYAPAVGQTVRLKIEDAADPTKSIEKDYVTTKANEWVTASFDFAAPSNGAYDAAATYNKVSLFPVFSVAAPPAADTTYYFDELKYTAATGGGGAVSGNTGTCTAPCIDFSSAAVKYEAFEGLVSAAQANDPVDASNKVAKFVKGPAGQPWAGATIYTVDADKSVTPINLSGSKVITLRVYAPAVGQTVRLKVENAADPTKSIEKDYVTTKANEWVTASFDFAAPSNGAYDAAATYNKVSLFPVFSVAAPPAADTTYYFDELKYTAAAGGGGGGGGGGASLTFASNYADAPPAWRSTELGDAGIYIDGSVPTQFWWSGIAPNDATPSFYFGYGINIANKPWGFGAFVKAPGNGTANVSGYSNVKISVWGNDQLVNTLPTFTVIFKGPSVANCVSELKSTLVVTGPGVQTYTLPLNGFTLQTACAYGSPAAALAAGVNEVHIQVLGNNVQYTSGGDAGGFYPNGLNVGPITFGN